ncbi:MAG: FeoB-associated Cys-rich membrane protein [Chitinispirillales bacterium]|nr:FeoB-associated Cys-rich membrane protein [Chitinispirillales bacterium]
MTTFLTENIGTILTGLVLLVIVTAIVCNLVRNKRNGKCACTCGCGICPNSLSCGINKD